MYASSETTALYLIVAHMYIQLTDDVALVAELLASLLMVRYGMVWYGMLLRDDVSWTRHAYSPCHHIACRVIPLVIVVGMYVREHMYC